MNRSPKFTSIQVSINLPKLFKSEVPWTVLRITQSSTFVNHEDEIYALMQ